jgi:thymidylate synthase (FAD)
MERVSENEFKVLDKGYVKLVDHMGSDASIVGAARVSYQQGTKSTRSDAGLIDYLIRNDHTSPLEMVEFVFEEKMPIFVARQMVRHRTASLNEVSARYSELPADYYVPTLDRMNPQSTTNKQGSEITVIEGAAYCQEIIDVHSREAYDRYQNLLSEGLSRELARTVLPVTHYTSWIWKIDLNNLFRMLRLRMDSHAQWEIREYANAKYELIKPYVPYACEAFERHMLNGAKFSSNELGFLRELLTADYDSLYNEMALRGFKDSHIKEFLVKLGVSNG